MERLIAWAYFIGSVVMVLYAMTIPSVPMAVVWLCNGFIAHIILTNQET